MSALVAAFPTDEELNEALSIRVPDVMRTMLQIAFEEATGDVGEFLNSYFDVANFYFAGELAALFVQSARESYDVRYASTPPELVPFGCPGRDGAHYGFIVHAPELDDNDFLVGELAPADDAGVLLIGRSTDDAIRNLVSFTNESNARAPETAVAKRLLSEFSISLDDDRDPLWMKDEKVVPTIPNGYAFRDTPDGIGVLAKSELFSASLEVPKRGSPAEAYLQAAERSLNAKKAGDALVLLKNAAWNFGHDGRTLSRLNDPMMRVYDALQRPVFSRFLDRNAARFGDQR